MKLTNLLQLINNLNQNINFFVQINDTRLPLSKITITNTECLIYPGKKALTKAQILSLIKNLHHKGISLKIVDKEKRIPIYGIQINLEKSIVTLV